VKTYGKPFRKDGIEYVRTVPQWKRPLYRLTVLVQGTLWMLGVPWHNPLSNECTPDFNCCVGK
jgi:hypothetical protein